MSDDHERSTMKRRKSHNIPLRISSVLMPILILLQVFNANCKLSLGASVNTAVNLANATSTPDNPNPNSASPGANSEVSAAAASETSTSRFKVEEVPNYEPILFTTSESGMTFSGFHHNHIC